MQDILPAISFYKNNVELFVFIAILIARFSGKNTLAD